MQISNAKKQETEGRSAFSCQLSGKTSNFKSIAIGGSNLIFTFAGLYLIDRIGRKKLLFISSFGYIISLSMVAYAFYAGTSRAFC